MDANDPVNPADPADPAITLTVSQQRFRAADAGVQEVHAVAAVQVSGVDGAAAGRPALAEVLVVDCSSSMREDDGRKFREAKRATVAALRLLPDGTAFAVVAGTHEAVAAYPPGGDRMAVADAATRVEAEVAVNRLIAAGGTCVGRWLDLSRDLLATRSAAIRHVLMLSDGRNEHDRFRPLAAALPTYKGSFVCDAWGFGEDWDAGLLLTVAGALHGRADAVREESHLTEAYEQLVRRLLAKSVPELTLTVDTVDGVALRYVRQSYPDDAPLAPEEGSPGAYVTRAWGNELRTFHICVTADPRDAPRGEDVHVADIGVTVPDGSGVAAPWPQPMTVHWTDDPALSGQSDSGVTHSQRWEELAKAVVDAADAHHAQRYDRATELLRQAVRLAYLIGAGGQLDALDRVVEIRDAAAGDVSLRPGLKAVDFQHLITTSTHTTPSTDLGVSPPAAHFGPETRTAPCPHCASPRPVGAGYCGACGKPWGKA